MGHFFKNFGIKFFIRLGVIAIVAIGFLIYSVTGIGNTESVKTANTIQSGIEELSSFKTGGVDLKSMHESYDYSGFDTSLLDELTPEQAASVEAHLAIGKQIMSIVPSVSEEAAGGVSAAYIGEQVSTDIVDGIFIIHSKDGIAISQELLDKANQFDNGEYYYIKGNNLIIVPSAFLEENQMDINVLSPQILEAIK